MLNDAENTKVQVPFIMYRYIFIVKVKKKIKKISWGASKENSPMAFSTEKPHLNS